MRGDLEQLAFRWKEEAEVLLDRHCRTGKWFSSMTEEEQARFREASTKALVLYSCANEINKILGGG